MITWLAATYGGVLGPHHKTAISLHCRKLYLEALSQYDGEKRPAEAASAADLPVFIAAVDILAVMSTVQSAG